jgi:ATP-binding protein involved in chromosome partitioning
MMGEVNHGNGAPEEGKEPLIPGVKQVIAVSSGKGGVGKSTVAVNLAVAMSLSGARVGLMDADVYGPNIPMMMGMLKPPAQKDGKIVPAENHGVKIMSIGFFRAGRDGARLARADDSYYHPTIFSRCALGDLEYLFIDLPPGTGDAQLTISQLVRLDGAVTVTTPQAVALHDVRKGLIMFQKVNVPLLGIIENMSYYVCTHCGTRSEIFSYGGGERAADKLGIPFLGDSHRPGY